MVLQCLVRPPAELNTTIRTQTLFLTWFLSHFPLLSELLFSLIHSFVGLDSTTPYSDTRWEQLSKDITHTSKPLKVQQRRPWIILFSSNTTWNLRACSNCQFYLKGVFYTILYIEINKKDLYKYEHLKSTNTVLHLLYSS